MEDENPRVVLRPDVPGPVPWCDVVPPDALEPPPYRVPVRVTGGTIPPYQPEPDAVPAHEPDPEDPYQMDPRDVPGGVVPERGTVVRVHWDAVIRSAICTSAPERARYWYDYGLTYQPDGGTAYVLALWTDRPAHQVTGTSRVLDGLPLPSAVAAYVRDMVEELERPGLGEDTQDQVQTSGPVRVTQTDVWGAFVDGLRRRSRKEGETPKR